MIQLLVDNSYSRVTGLSVLQTKELRKLLSYTTGSYFTRFGPIQKSMLSKRGEFPTGLLARVTAYLGKFGYARRDLRALPIVNITPVESNVGHYQSQVDAVLAALARHQGTIAMPTGSGKSRVIRLLAETLGLKTLVVVPSIEIKRQLSELLQYTKGVIVENIDSKALQTLSDFDCLIIDEAHHVAAKTYQKLNRTVWKGIYYRFFLTATPFRSNEEENLLFEGIAGPCIYRLSYQDAVDKGYIVPIEAYYIDVKKQKTEAEGWAQVYSKLVVKNTPRNHQIATLLTSLHSSKKSTLCLVKEVSHGEKLSELTGLPFCSGKDEDSRKYISRFNKGEISVLIATTGMMGEGIDTKPCEFVVIAGLGRAKSQFMQQVGRCVRTFLDKESGKVILFQDKSHRFLSRHFRAQRDILKEEYGVILGKLEEL